MSECIFCNIIAGTIPSSAIFSSAKLYAFLDLNPANKGHTLIVPRLHCKDLLEVSPELGADLLTAMQKIARAVLSATQAQGFNVIQNNGRIAGQMVDHLHWHIIPRFAQDGFHLWKQHQYDSREEMDRLAGDIRALL